MRLDSHQHFWQFDPIRDAWMAEGSMDVIRKNFMPQDLKPILVEHKFDGCVLVQVNQSTAENDFMVDLASKNEFIKGIVGWVDFKSKDLAQQLEKLDNIKIIKGFRHILQGEKPEFMLEQKFIKGIKQLKNTRFTYDILVFPKHLSAVKKLLNQCPDQPFVIDHLAKPYIKKGLIKQWEKDMRAIAQHQNVMCKISGWSTEADWSSWKTADIKPYVDVMLESFGTKRLMYGSDWPVSLLASDYKTQLNTVEELLKNLSPTEKQDIFGLNAAEFYGI